MKGLRLIITILLLGFMALSCGGGGGTSGSQQQSQGLVKIVGTSNQQ